MIKILAILDDSVKDNATGHYSHSRIIALLIAFGATVFMWKLILLGGMGIEYFLGYLAYGTGQMTMNKFLDNKDTARADQAKIKNTPQPTPSRFDADFDYENEPDYEPRPPRKNKYIP
jgi:hypothetical protein